MLSSSYHVRSTQSQQKLQKTENPENFISLKHCIVNHINSKQNIFQRNQHKNCRSENENIPSTPCCLREYPFKVQKKTALAKRVKK